MLDPEFREARRDLFMQGIGLRAYSKAPVTLQVTRAQAKSKKTK